VQAKLVSYGEVRETIRDGSVLLRRAGRDPGDVAIAEAGDGLYAHAGMAGWWRSVLMCLETRQWFGGRAVTFSSQVAAAPGQWDVYDVRPLMRSQDLRRWHAVLEMVRICGAPYGWRSLCGVAARHLPVIRWLLGPQADPTPEEARARPPFCSEAVSWAWKCGGVSLVPEKPDSLTEPSDLSRSARLVYRFTLFP
jgi:hypothetical protein